MKILFVLNTPGFLRYFDVTIDRLLADGHDVSLAFTRPDLRPESLEIYDGRERRPHLLGKAPDRTDRFASLAEGIRAAVDFVRYLDPFFADAEYLRNRRRGPAFQLAPWTRVLGYRRSLPRWLIARVVRGLLALERAIPAAPEIDAYLRESSPDVLVLSPLVNGASPQTDYVKSAASIGLSCAVCIASWDNLTNKGLVRLLPDRLVVWNEAQQWEAMEFHGVPADRIAVVGAQPFDRWFGRNPAESRDNFCERVGLPPDRPYVMFVGSTSNIAREGVEEDFVRRWIEAIRSDDDPDLSRAGILVRLHPDRRGSWDAVDLDGVEDVVLWPPSRPNSVVADARTEYFDSIAHSAAVVGINTSAMIEAAVIDKPVLTLRQPEFTEAQRGTIHFRYLVPENGGFLLVAEDMDEHLRQLARSISDPATAAYERDRFVRAFVRPAGRERPANDVLVEEILACAARPAQPPHASHEPALVRQLVSALAAWRTWRRRRLDPAAAAERVGARTSRLEALAERTGSRTHLSTGLLGAAARSYAHTASLRVRYVRWRHEAIEAARKSRRRRAKQKGDALLRGQR